MSVDLLKGGILHGKALATGHMMIQSFWLHAQSRVYTGNACLCVEAGSQMHVLGPTITSNSSFSVHRYQCMD